jgi:hypothetical protein
MLDLKKCPGCGNNTSLNTMTCPYCGHRFADSTAGTPVSPSSTIQHRCPNCDTPVTRNHAVCPNCRVSLKEKRGRGRYLILAGIVAAAVLLAVFVFPVPGFTVPVTNSSVASPVTPAPTLPGCNIAIAGQKMPTGTIQLHLMALTCGPDDVRELAVMVNGEKEGTLKYQLGSMGTYPGHAGVPDNVVVVATFRSGYEKTVMESRYQ